MAQFPIILIPIELQRVMRNFSATQVAQEPPPKPPQPPSREPEPVAIARIIIDITIVIAVVSFVSALPFIPNRLALGMVLMAVGTAIIVFRVRWQFISYKRRLQEHSFLLEAYFRRLEAFSIKESQYQQAIARSQNPQKLAADRRHAVLAVLSRTIPPPTTLETLLPADSANHIPKASSAVQQLGVLLHQFFGDRIHTGASHYLSSNSESNLANHNPQINELYAPDFIYMDREANLYIAIEVDEPYGANTQAPTHYRDNWEDRRNEQFLLERGWLIVRFSEQQANESPQSCCQAIAHLLADLWGDMAYC